MRLSALHQKAAHIGLDFGVHGISSSAEFFLFYFWFHMVKPSGEMYVLLPTEFDVFMYVLRWLASAVAVVVPSRPYSFSFKIRYLKLMCIMYLAWTQWHFKRFAAFFYHPVSIWISLVLSRHRRSISFLIVEFDSLTHNVCSRVRAVRIMWLKHCICVVCIADYIHYTISVEDCLNLAKRFYYSIVTDCGGSFPFLHSTLCTVMATNFHFVFIPLYGI